MHRYPVGFVLFCLLRLQSFSQGEAGVPFLLISPSAEASGMGESGVATRTSDPLASAVNPAHIGFPGKPLTFSAGYNYSSWLPTFQAPGMNFSTLGLTAGFDLSAVMDSALPLSFGMGYSRVHLNLGTFLRMNSSGQIVGTFEAEENSDQLTFGVGFDAGVRVSAGMTYKHVVSRLGSLVPGNPGSDARADLVDYGILLDVPVAGFILGREDDPPEPTPRLRPFLDWTVGVSRSNLGQGSIFYLSAQQPDLLPRYARAGMGVLLGFSLHKGDVVLDPVSLQWVIEAGDLLVTRDRKYQGGLGDIRFFDEVILGRTNIETEKRKGWELDVLETVQIRGGSFLEDPNRGNRRFSTTGWGFSVGGFMRSLRIADVEMPDEGVAGFILNHIDIRYNHSSWEAGPGSPLAGTKFDSVNLIVAR